MTPLIRSALAAGMPLLMVGLAQAADQAHPAPDTLLGVHLVPIAVNVDHPSVITHAGDGSGRIFIVLQDGKIVVWDGTQVLATPFLDIDPIVNSSGQEQGLLGLAFHPDYESNGYFYVDYTDTTGGDTIIARYSVSAGNPNVADPASALILMEIDQPFANHNGGQLQFGPDGYLYIGMGDGGSAGDPGNRAQDLTKPLGKILRIDVNGGGVPADCGGGSNYTIPADNPFVDGPGGSCDEVWQYGLRNPWRFSFDRLTGDLFIADVGQGDREEIDVGLAARRGGENWGWNTMEGSRCFRPATGCNTSGLSLPVAEYDHSGGACSVTGGVVYRGCRLPGYAGTYFYADYCAGFVRSFRLQNGVATDQRDWTAMLSRGLDAPTSFGVDADGEVYIVDGDGEVYRIVPAG